MSKYVPHFLFLIILSVTQYVATEPYVFPHQTIMQGAWYDWVENYCLSSLKWEDEEYPQESFYKHLMRCMEYARNPSQAKIQRAAFKIVNHEYKKLQIQTSLNDTMTWQDLCLFTGKAMHDEQGYSLLHVLDRTQTVMGRAVLAGMFVQPTASIRELELRKKFLEQLVEDQKLFERIATALEHFKKAEALLLSFWMNDPLKQPLERHYYNFPPKAQQLSTFLNNSVLALNIKSNLEHAKRYIFFLSAAFASIILPRAGLSHIRGIYEPELVTVVQDIYADTDLPADIKLDYMGMAARKAARPSMLRRLSKELKGTGGPTLALVSASVENQRVTGIAFILAGLYCAASAKEDYEWARDNVVLDVCAQEKMMAVAQTMHALNELSTCLDLCPDRGAFLRFGHEMRTFLTNNAQNPTKQRLLELLQTDTFQGEPSPFSSTGRVLISYALMQTLKNCWAPALAAVGELDAYMSMATLYKQFGHQPNHYCFVDFIQANKPLLMIDDFWNPFINNQMAVSNSLHFGDDNKNSIILNGPNAGGKSTILRGLGINVLLAQTFGIAAAKTMALTPFTTLATYFNAADDLVEGKSLFRAEILRAHELIAKVEQLQPGQFGFILADELFKGTSPQEAEAAAYSVAKYLGSGRAALTIVATHFPLLVTLADACDNFVNYMVTVTMKTDGNLNYPFKLERGIAQQNVALAMLRSQGFKSSILDEVCHMLEAGKNSDT